jgi:aminopeptidase N
VGKTLVEVYATKEAEAALEKRHEVQAPAVIETLPPRGEGHSTARIVPQFVAPLKPDALLEPIAENAAEAIQYYEKQFGAFPYPRVAISQIPGNFGQGWPELVYLPTLSFLPEAERSAMGFTKTEDDLLTRSALAHEIAHQWWGNLVGWKTYHDQWLSEGLASYAAVLWLAQEKDGERKSRQLLQIFKRDLLRKTQAGNTIESGGPIWLGERLSNSLDPDGYMNIVYKKACWILHMLRDLMTDARGSDERFARMLHDFLAAHRNEEVSTEDFVRHAEKYMTRSMDLEHDGRLEWFFDEWVYSTGIPTYHLTSKTRRLGPEKFLVQGTIEQAGVPSDFEMLVPVVALTTRNKKVRLGQVAVGDSGGHFRFTTTSKPEHVMIDEDNLLALVH